MSKWIYRVREWPLGYQLALFISVYIAVSWYSIAHLRIAGEGVSFFWPGTGIAFATVMLASKRDWPLVLGAQFIANVAGNWLAQVPLGPALSYSAVDTATTGLFCLVYGKSFTEFYSFNRVHVVRNFYLSVGLVSVLGGLVGGVLGAFFYGNTPYLLAVIRWSLAGLTSAWLLTPFLVIAAVMPLHPPDPVPQLEVAGRKIPVLLERAFIHLLVIGASYYFFVSLRMVPGQTALIRSYLLFPLFFWVANRLSVVETAFLLNVTSLLALYGVSDWLGEFSVSDYFMSENVATAHFFILALVFTTMLLRLAGRRIRTSNDNLTNALRSSAITFDTSAVGILHAAADGSPLRVNCALRKMLGYGVGQDLPDLLQVFYDQESYTNYLSHFKDPNGWTGRSVHLRRADGSKVFADLTAHPSFNEQGETYFEVFVSDITGEVQAREDLRANEMRLRLGLQNSRVGVWEMNLRSKELTLSQSAKDLFERGGHDFDFDRASILSQIHPEDQEDLFAAGDGLASGLTNRMDVELRIALEPQGWKWLHLVGSVTERDEQGKPLRLLGTAVDIHNLKTAKVSLRRANQKLNKQLEESRSLQQRLQEEANHDVLTGLYNRRFYEETLRREVVRSAHETTPFSIVLLDIDFHKQVVNSLGIEKGNLALQLMCEALKGSTRHTDFVCRLDADQFALVLPGSSAKDATKLAERAITDFNAHVRNNIGLSLTATAVVAEHPNDGINPESLMTKTAMAMLKAKSNTRGSIYRV